MIENGVLVLSLVLFFTSIGIYSKLHKYNVPKSAVMYAFCIPIISFIENIQVTNESFTEYFAEKKRIQKVVGYIRMQFFSVRYFKMLNSINILKYGKLKLNFTEFIFENLDIIDREKTNEELDKSLNCDFSRHIAKEFEQAIA